MPTSINGWPVLDSPPWSDVRLGTKPIPACPTRKLTMNKDVLPLFLAFASDYHREIAPLDTGALDDWSYDYRIARASGSWSDHSSGTAIDRNASKEGGLGYGPLAWWKQGKRALTARRAPCLSPLPAPPTTERKATFRGASSLGPTSCRRSHKTCRP